MGLGLILMGLGFTGLFVLGLIMLSEGRATVDQSRLLLSPWPNRYVDECGHYHEDGRVYRDGE